MDISNQIKKRRTDMGLSQEELAERIYVSRQTISNWETDKTYPDIQSLLMLSVLFDTTIDVLVKGDLEMMEKTVASADAKKMRTLGIGMYALLVLMIPFALVGIALWGALGVLLGLVPWAASMVVGVMVERMKVENDVQTFREVLAFTKGEAIDRSTRSSRAIARQAKMKRAFGEKPLWQAIVRGLGIGIAAVVLGATVGYASAMLLDMPLSF
ncbi:helix-turn-helix transcriptional regulator [Slackia sp.]|uniref:helix-turn-helix transcriptional regulator n=1 Tax=Slackia sp. TaxID=2049041 RepID=UPI003A9719C4